MQQATQQRPRLLGRPRQWRRPSPLCIVVFVLLLLLLVASSPVDGRRRRPTKKVKARFRLRQWLKQRLSERRERKKARRRRHRTPGPTPGPSIAPSPAPAATFTPSSAPSAAPSAAPTHAPSSSPTAPPNYVIFAIDHSCKGSHHAASNVSVNECYTTCSIAYRPPSTYFSIKFNGGECHCFNAVDACELLPLDSVSVLREGDMALCTYKILQPALPQEVGFIV